MPTGKRLEYRRSLEEFVNRAIDIYKNMNPFDISIFKQRIFQEPGEQEKSSTSLHDIFDRYLRFRGGKIALKTIIGLKSARNSILRFRPDCKLEDVNVRFMEEYERWYNESHKTIRNASVGIHLRALRSVINHLKNEDDLPKGYVYPFGRGKYVFKNVYKHKQALQQSEIQSIINLNEFKSSEERKARDYWLLQYYCNGINFNDLIRIRWDNIVGNCFVIERQKTKNTTASRAVLIKIPLIEKLKDLLEKVGDKKSPYVLGLLTEEMTERQILDKKERVAYSINPHLKEIGKRLNLSIELVSETSRDAYATTLKRNGASYEEIAEMLGQTSTACTKYYLDHFDESTVTRINSLLP